MQELKFKQDPDNEKKLVIIGESDRAKIWVSQLRESSKRVNKDCEHYALKAFNLWCQGRGTNNLALRLKQSEAAIAKEVADNLAASKPDADGRVLIECSALLHHVFRCNLKDCIRPSKKQYKDTIVVHIAVEGIVSQGAANTFKKAKVRAAKAFLRVINKHVKREYNKEEEDTFKTNF